MRENKYQSLIQLLGCRFIRPNLGGVKSILLHERYYFMGISMLLIVFYHMKCALNSYKLVGLKPFTYGFIGVDIFFFFSALGLCFSYSKNNLSRFYLRRLIRIIPLFIIWAIVHLGYMHFLQDVSINVEDVIYCLTTVSYYNIGSVRSNWYLSALIAFYLAFPLLYHFVKKIKAAAVLGLLSLSLFLEYCFLFEWYHESFIGRFSIFAFGILVYFGIKGKECKNIMRVLCGFMLVPLLIIVFHYYLLDSGKNWLFIITACISPVLILILAFLFKEVEKVTWLKKLFDFIGKHSLEFFIGNCWTMLLMNEIITEKVYGLMTIYILSNTIFGLCLIPVNNMLTKWLQLCLNARYFL